MLPPLALAPAAGSAVLDMCASPGSKTGLLGQLVGENGFVLGNEPSKNRLATLRRNLQSLNLFCCATTSHPGENLPLPAPGSASLLPHASAVSQETSGTASGQACDTHPGWSFIQLDPPCSGWGTVDKNPQVMNLWQGEKVKPLITLQRRLLAEATRLLQPGGRLVYSTCTTNVEENEEQLRYACDELGLEFAPLAPLPGFSFADPELPEFSGSLRVNTGSDGQGFFVATLHKPAGEPEYSSSVSVAEAPYAANSRHTSKIQDSQAIPSHEHEEPPLAMKQGFFVRPWEKESRFVGEHRRHAKAQKSGHSKAPFDFLSREALRGFWAGSCVDAGLLPPGDIAVFNGVAHFLPQHSRALLPSGFSWKGFPLGKIGGGSGKAESTGDHGIRVQAFLHGLMPSLDVAQKYGVPCLNLDDTAPLLSLLTGQSLAVNVQGPELGLYFRGLPLCRLTVKGKRAVLPPS